TEEHFTLPEHKQVYLAVMEAEAAGQHGSVLDRLPDDGSRRLAAELALTPLTTEAVDEVFITLHGALLERQIASLRATLDRLDPVADQHEYDSTFAELMRLESQRRRFDDR
ncbi:MAG TPA: hypothetical protein VKY26_13325, partial [Actinomycetota bacterium]|nr:hypothetical protein [Actinomycetota bacterium]